MELIKKHDKTAVLLIAPETGRLPESMGPLSRYISGKSGGLGEVVAALCDGLTQRGIAGQPGGDTFLLAVETGPDAEGHPSLGGHRPPLRHRSWRRPNCHCGRRPWQRQEPRGYLRPHRLVIGRKDRLLPIQRAPFHAGLCGGERRLWGLSMNHAARLTRSAIFTGQRRRTGIRAATTKRFRSLP